MIDCFALLDQPRAPWLDADQLKQAFHTKSLHAHPDARPRDASSRQDDGAFSKLNEAYQVLQDPKRRINHLLSLEGRAPTGTQSSVPPEVEQLFSAVAAVTREADALGQEWQSTTAPLSRSLLKPKMLEVQRRIAETLQQLAVLHDDGVAELQRLSGGNALEEDDWQRLHRLYLRFSYITRWTAELEEKQSRIGDS